jgi:hypothetical protein
MLAHLLVAHRVDDIPSTTRKDSTVSGAPSSLWRMRERLSPRLRMLRHLSDRLLIRAAIAVARAVVFILNLY